ncbi:MAG TPA: hypothetical protein PK264_01715, partial [Hyphomicrobiaceae bacterium]|nr:hypothetical protein [Hyphomicrobiaceae bacterium]
SEPVMAPLPTGSSCVDDSKRCVDERSLALKALMADKDKRWLREPSTPAAHASGVRLFAMQQRKRELTCEELALAKREADRAPAELRGPGGAGLAPGQVSRGVILAGEVGRELMGEMKRRCRV